LIQGRCYGDISASGRNYPTFINGNVVAVDGTSASAPTVAALFALINDELLRQGLRPVGWINPALYRMPFSCFFDVVLGTTECPEVSILSLRDLSFEVDKIDFFFHPHFFRI
jgi:tripeptidyl-peptidase-1